MGWFTRKDDTTEPEPDAGRYRPTVELTLGDDDRPASAPIGDAEREHIAMRLEQLRVAGTDVDDLQAIGAAYDRALAEFESGSLTEGPDAAVDRIAVAIGEHLARTTDLRWLIVGDVFGTDLGLMGLRGDDVIVPLNLVGARWMRRESGWVPNVVSHWQNVRTR